MEGQQLPKATMNNFLKNHTNLSFSAEFLAKILMLSKEFISRLADKSNQMCEQYNKKTISAEHLEAALISFGLDKHIDKLKELGTNIKQFNQLKREASQRLEETIEKELRQERQRKLLEQPEKKEVVVRQKFQQIEEVVLDIDDDQDYENLVEDVDEIKKPSK